MCIRLPNIFAMLSFTRYFSGLISIVIAVFIMILMVIDIVVLILCIMNFSVLASGVGLGKV